MSQTLFTSQTPVVTDNFDNSPITLATTVFFDVAGTVSGGRFFGPLNALASGTYEMVLWRATSEDPPSGAGTGTILATKTFTPTPGGWSTVTFTSPVTVDATSVYKIGVRSSLGRYTFTSNFFAAASLVSGNITGPRSATNTPGRGTFLNGSFATDITSYPNQAFSATSYFVDVLFDPTGAPEVTLAANLTATASMTVSDRVETTLAAAFTARSGMTAALSNPTSGPVDPIGTPVAEELLACFTTKLLELPSPPKYIQLRVGQETGPLIGPNIDECCAGLAWIRITDIYPSWNSFPGPDYDWLPCGPLAYAVVLEMGMAFCMPWSDSDDTIDNLDPPNTQDWATAFATQMQHQTLMRQTAACCFLPTQRRAVGAWSPLPVEGGCTGGKLTVTVSVMAPCSDC